MERNVKTVLRRCESCQIDFTDKWARQKASYHRKIGHRVVWFNPETGEVFENWPGRIKAHTSEGESEEQEAPKVIYPAPVRTGEPSVAARVGHGIYRIVLRGFNWDFTEEMFNEWASTYHFFKHFYGYDGTPGQFVNRCVQLARKQGLAFLEGVKEDELKEVLYGTGTKG